MEIELLRQREAEITKIIEALIVLDKSKEWATLRELVFDKALKAIEREMQLKSQATQIETESLYRLQGEYKWAKRYCDIDKYIENLKIELESIKNRLKLEQDE